MEFLPTPCQPVHPRPEVPYLGTDEYSPPFLTYPERAGWANRPIREWQKAFEERPDEIAALLHTWFYCGVLYCVVGNDFSLKNFTRETKDWGTIIDTGRVPDRVKQRWALRQSSTTQDLITYSGPFGAGLGEIAIVVRHLSEAGAAADGVRALTTYQPDPVPLHIFLRHGWFENRLNTTIFEITEMLLMFLVAAEHHMANEIRDEHQEYRDRHNLQMRKSGWCPYEITLLDKRFNMFSMYYLSLLERPGLSRVHPFIRVYSRAVKADGRLESVVTPETARTLCSKQRCVPILLSQEDYKTKHVDGCEGCHDVVANQDEIRSILRSGAYPLVLSIDDDDRETEVKIVPYADDLPYVAISHVWSDGLGNLHQTALPRCQLRRLSRLIRNLPPPNEGILLFWLDTLCCPPDDGEAQDLAIGMMRETYLQASVVLVLDSWLQEQTLSRLSDHEICLRCLASPWNTRLWTLQEGALAQTLLFQFADAVYEVEEGVRRIYGSEDNLIEDVVFRAGILQKFEEFRGFRSAGYAHDKFVSLAGALECRSTSVATDEALCLAAMLDLDVARFVQCNLEERMLEFWKSLKEVPAVLVFWGAERLKQKGYRWAPSTLLAAQPRGTRGESIDFTNLRQYGPGVRTLSGLNVRFPGYMIQVPEGQMMNPHIFFRDQHHRWYQLVCNPELMIERFKAVSSGWQRDGDLAGLLSFFQNRWAVIVLYDHGEQELIIRGILCFVEKEEAGIVYARFIVHVSVEIQNRRPDFNPAFLARFETDKTLGTRPCGGCDICGGARTRHDSHGIAPFVVDFRDAQQRWCID